MRQPKPKRRTRGLTKIRKTEISRVVRGIKAADVPLRGVEVDHCRALRGISRSWPWPVAKW
jgi:hypothetical protein